MEKQRKMQFGHYPDFESPATDFKLASFEAAVRREAHAFGIDPRDLPRICWWMMGRQRKRLEKSDQRLRRRGAA